MTAAVFTVQCQTKRNETKTENAQKDGMKTQRKRENKRDQSKKHERQQPRAFQGGRKKVGGGIHSFQLNEMMCVYDEEAEAIKKHTKTIAIVVVCPLSMLLLLLYYYCWYCFACGSFLDKSLRFFLVQFSFATKTALCLFCLLSKYAKTFCILVAASRFGCCCCCFVSFGCTF